MGLTSLNQLEDLRLQMQRIAIGKELTDPIVVKVSEKLDILITEFYMDQKKLRHKAQRQRIII
ncbi:aspartyl-phosphate phosphatase Spo0E family protein [Desulfosporosinus acidiphilus]|uniref:aspartyl-phosphate phosphatase Spo0E family protein n=1 Tax=Desulfosporosinus acidiphilus TaxID=885581 RepID=UPI0002E40AFC|nr:aspartyl-phosphate phosphatase Spo0E family protein [Desulfosporosinus acidiphilus]